VLSGLMLQACFLTSLTVNDRRCCNDKYFCYDTYKMKWHFSHWSCKNSECDRSDRLECMYTSETLMKCCKTWWRSNPARDRDIDWRIILKFRTCLGLNLVTGFCCNCYIIFVCYNGRSCILVCPLLAECCIRALY